MKFLFKSPVTESICKALVDQLYAARDIRDQLTSQGEPAPWSECLRWAASCRREAEQKRENDRLAFHAARREQLRGVRFRQTLAKAGRSLEGAQAREGRPGLGVTYCPKTFTDPNLTRIAALLN